MKKSSTNRLTPGQAHLFPGSSLFDKIARAVCSAGTLPRKELYESWEMARRVRRKFKGGRIVDLACGHGLLAHILMLLDDTSPTAVAVDARIPDNARRLSEILLKRWPRLKNRIQYVEADIDQVEIFPGDLVVSAHACGGLTDAVMDRAMEKNAAVAVLPCCHDTKQSDLMGLEGWMDKTLVIDCLRAVKLSQHGYQVLTREIPVDITPKNRLLMGKPGQQ